MVFKNPKASSLRSVVVLRVQIDCLEQDLRHFFFCITQINFKVMNDCLQRFFNRIFAFFIFISIKRRVLMDLGFDARQLLGNLRTEHFFLLHVVIHDAIKPIFSKRFFYPVEPMLEDLGDPRRFFFRKVVHSADVCPDKFVLRQNPNHGCLALARLLEDQCIECKFLYNKTVSHPVVCIL